MDQLQQDLLVELWRKYCESAPLFVFAVEAQDQTELWEAVKDIPGIPEPPNRLVLPDEMNRIFG